MKLIIHILFVFLLFNCSKTKEEETQLLISKNNFSVSGFDRKLDSLNDYYVKDDSLEILVTTYDKRLNKSYLQGAIHFLILDKNKSYYVIRNLKQMIFMCGNRAEFSKRDSIIFVENSNKLTNKMQPIKTSEIPKILGQHKKSIVKTENNSPLNISFAFKNDTLNGSTMYHIVRFMENNGMKSYTIRRMNEYELRKTE